MENTAKNFALQLGALVSLYIVIGSLISLLFAVITIAFPDPAQYAWEGTSASFGIRSAIAVLIVFFPTYAILTRIVNTVRRKEQGVYLGLTKWLIYLSLLVGGGVLLGDLVFVLTNFLNGELTIRFILKALTVFIVVGTAVVYYFFDVRGYWQTHEKHSLYYGSAMALIVVASLFLGFAHTDSPAEVREQRIDEQQISDLQQIQYQVEMYVTLNNKLPETLKDAYGNLSLPQASAERMQYTYEMSDATHYKLCAQFEYPTPPGMQPEVYYTEVEKGITVTSWLHEAGVWCFERAISTENLTPLKR